MQTMTAYRLITLSKSEEEISFLWTDMHTQARKAINLWPCNIILVLFLFLKAQKEWFPKAWGRTVKPAAHLRNQGEDIFLGIFRIFLGAADVTAKGGSD